MNFDNFILDNDLYNFSINQKFFSKNILELSSNEESDEENRQEPNDDWAHEAIQELEDWIESQGVYIRQ